MTQQSAVHLPLSAAQEGVWFAHQMDPAGWRYNCVEYLDIEGPVDVGLFRSAWSVLREEIEVIRVRSVAEEAGLWQIVDPGTNADLPFLDLGDDADPERRAHEWMQADMACPVDFDTGPISAFCLLRLADDRFFFYCRMHHIVIDAFGISLLEKRLAEIYTSLAAGDGPVAAQPRSLARLLEEDVAYRTSAAFAADRRYWMEHFGDSPAPMRVSTRSASGTPGRSGPLPLRRVRSLPQADSDLLEETARTAGTTWQVVLIAVTAAYVRRVTGRRDVVLGLPVAGRRTLASRRTPGMVTNTVALRVDVEPTVNLARLITQVAEEIGRALNHERYRHEDLCRDLGVTGSEGGFMGPMVNFMPFDRELRFGERRATVHNLAAGPTVDLSIGVQGNGGAGTMSLVFEANPELHGGEELAAHQDRFTAFTGRLMAAPDRPLEAFDLLTPAERHLLIETRNATARPVPAALVPAQVKARAEGAPRQTAVVFEGRTLTYGELDARSDRLAGRLRDLGAGPEKIVALALPRSPELVIAMLAVLKAGAAYISIDLAYPAERIEYMLADAAPMCVVTGAETGTRLPDGTVTVPVGGEADGGDGERRDGASRSIVAVDPANPAYLIYTSGSTGTPKGVVVPHSGLVNLVADHVERFGMGSESRVLQFVSSGFDAAVADIWPTLVSGGRLVLAPEGPMIDVRSLMDLLRDERVTHVALPPAVLGQLPREDLPDLAVLVVGGEATEPVVVERWAPGRTMLNMYGPTEASVAATASPPLAAGGPQPIGGPISNVRVYVLDEGLQPVVPGATGELYITGTGLARGYLRRPSLTAERFLPCPHGPAGSLMYRTGDLARWRADGDLEYLGRVDDQVKIRGIRIELGEIEAVIGGHASVDAVVVVAREDQPGRRQLVAYVVPVPGVVVNHGELRHFARRSLPDFMVPAAVVSLDTLPLTPHGKVDRHALPRPDFASSGPERLPRTPHERLLCELFTEVLAVARIDPGDSFFDLGGDSITVLQLVSRARRAGMEFTSREVFQHPTVLELAALAGKKETDRPVAEAPGAGIGPVSPTPIVRWLLEQTGPIDAFHQAVLLQVPQRAGSDGTLAEVLRAVIDHHDALRSRLCRTGDGALRLEVMPRGTPIADTCLTRIDITGMSDLDVREAVEVQRSVACRRLEPEQGVMVQAVWFDAGPERAGRLLLVLHHLAVDGVSWRILLPDLASAWEGISTTGRAVLEPTGTSLRTWAGQLSAAASDEVRVGELAMWAEILRTPDPELAGRPLDPELDTFATARTIHLTLVSPETEALLTTVPALFRARTGDVLLTGLVLAFAEWRARRSAGAAHAVLLDLEGHGREEIVPHARLDRTVGWFTSLYPVRLDPGAIGWDEVRAGGPALGQAVKRVKEQLRAIPDNGIGFGLLRYLNPKTAPGLEEAGTPQLAFNYLGRFPMAEGGDWNLADGEAGFSGEADPEMAMVHGLEINAITYDRPGGPEMKIMVTWAGELFEEHEIRELMELWNCAIEGLATYGRRPGAGGLTPSDLPLVRLTQSQIDALVRVYPDMSDVLPLSPLQEGFLFHSLLTEQTVDVYAVQLSVDIEGALDPQRMLSAAEAVLDRHANLRVAFQHEDLPEAVQIVCDKVVLPWTETDLSELEEHDRQQAAQRLAAAETSHRFDLSKPPLMRFLVLKLDTGRYRLVLTSHHILWDGWSISILIRELFTLYTAGTGSGNLTTVAPYRDYLAWLAAQDRPEARRAWAAALEGVTRPTLVVSELADQTQAAHEQIRHQIDEEPTATLVATAAAGGITLNTVVQGAWALLLSRLTGQEDVMFGTSVSGRPPELPGVENMVGLLAATIPVRVRLDGRESLLEMLVRLQAEQAIMLPHHHLGLAEIQREVNGGREGGFDLKGRSMFDTTTMVMNYPFDTSDWAEALGELRMSAYEMADDTHYPLRLVVIPGSRLSLWLGYRPDVFDRRAAEQLLESLLSVLETIGKDPGRPVGDLNSAAEEERRRLLMEWGGYG